MVNQTLDRYVVNGHTNSEEDIERAQNEILLQTWVVVVELRSYFCALLQNYINIKDWRKRASIPLPSACKADALPSELFPHLQNENFNFV